MSTLDERIAAIVQRTLAEQNLDLEVRDPVALHTVAVHILAARAQHNGGRVMGRNGATLRRRGRGAAQVAAASGGPRT